MPPIDSSIIETLKKILAKADPTRGATEAEASAAMAAAQRLAIKHNIDLASVSVDEPGAIKIETDRVDLGGDGSTRRPHYKPIARCLQNCFDIRVIYCGPRVVLIGEKTDLAIAQYCWAWLSEVFPRLYREYVKERGSFIGDKSFDTVVRRRSFYEGMQYGIQNANARQRAEVRTSSDGERYALVLVRKEEVVAERVTAEFPQLRSMRDHTTGTLPGAFYNGQAQGSKIKLNGGLATTRNAGHLS